MGSDPSHHHAERSSWIAVCSGLEIQFFHDVNELETREEPFFSLQKPHGVRLGTPDWGSVCRPYFSAASFVGDECEFLALGASQLVTLVDLLERRVRWTSGFANGNVRTMCEVFTSPSATAGRSLVACAGFGSGPIVWDAETGTRCCQLQGSVRGALVHDYSHQNLLWGCGTPLVFAWDLEKESRVIEMGANTASFYSLTVDDATPDGPLFATGDSHGIHMFAPRMNCAHQPTRIFNPDSVKFPYDICYDPASHSLVILHSTNQVAVMDVRQSSPTGTDGVVRSFQVLPRNDTYPDNKQLFPVGPDMFAVAHRMKIVSVIRPSRGEVLFQRSFSGIVNAVDCPYRRRARFGDVELMESAVRERERCEFAFRILRAREYGGLVRVIQGSGRRDFLLVRSLVVLIDAF